jgi:hypothetical protein
VGHHTIVRENTNDVVSELGIDIYNFTSIFVFIMETKVNPSWYYMRPIFVTSRPTYITAGNGGGEVDLSIPMWSFHFFGLYEDSMNRTPYS